MLRHLDVVSTVGAQYRNGNQGPRACLPARLQLENVHHLHFVPRFSNLRLSQSVEIPWNHQRMFRAVNMIFLLLPRPGPRKEDAPETFL